MPGMSDRNAWNGRSRCPESVIAMPGMGDHVPLESVITIGRNTHDSAGFRPFEPLDSRSLSEVISTWIAELTPNVDLVYLRIKERAPQAAVFVLGYPRLLATGSCLQLEGALFDSSERQFLANVATDLNSTLTNVAQQKGVHFVDIKPHFTRAPTAYASLRQDGIYDPHYNPVGTQTFALALFPVLHSRLVERARSSE